LPVDGIGFNVDDADIPGALRIEDTAQQIISAPKYRIARFRGR
jgi:hypothetical protein